jgi:hypothetical protein
VRGNRVALFLKLVYGCIIANLLRCGGGVVVVVAAEAMAAAVGSYHQFSLSLSFSLSLRPSSLPTIGVASTATAVASMATPALATAAASTFAPAVPSASKRGSLTMEEMLGTLDFLDELPLPIAPSPADRAPYPPSVGLMPGSAASPALLSKYACDPRDGPQQAYQKPPSEGKDN